MQGFSGRLVCFVRAVAAARASFKMLSVVMRSVDLMVVSALSPVVRSSFMPWRLGVIVTCTKKQGEVVFEALTGIVGEESMSVAIDGDLAGKG